MCVVTHKGFRFVVIHLGDLLSVSIQRRKESLQFLWDVVKYLLYSRHVQSSQKEQIQQPQSGSGAV